MQVHTSHGITLWFILCERVVIATEEAVTVLYIDSKSREGTLHPLKFC